MKFWKPEFMAIQEKLLVIMKRSNEAKSVAEIDKCISDYQTLLGDLEDESEGLKCIEQLRDAKAQELITRTGNNLVITPKNIKLN